MLGVKNLQVSIDQKLILQNINLNLSEGIYAIIGPNGSGKSTLAKAIMGLDNLTISAKELFWQDENLVSDLKNTKIWEKARCGLFFIPQQIPNLEGISTVNLLKTALSQKAKAENKQAPASGEILNLIKEKAKLLNLSDELWRKPISDLSLGQKKQLEILQMLVLKPKMAILDEIDSGLDLDAVRLIAKIVNQLSTDKTTFLFISHSTGFLHLLKLKEVMVLLEGQIKAKGQKELLFKLEKEGFAAFK